MSEQTTPVRARKYHLKEAIYDVARPVLESAGFTLSSKHGDHIFRRDRKDGLEEAVAFCTGKYRNDVIVDVALVRPGRNPFEAFPITRRKLTEGDRQIGVRDPLGRIVHGDRYFQGRDGFTWETKEELKAKVREVAELVLRHGPAYWNEMARRMTTPQKARKADTTVEGR